MKKTKPETLSYILRDIPRELWDRAKHQAINEGISLRELLFRALTAYLKDHEGH